MGEGPDEEDLEEHVDGFGFVAYPPSQLEDVSASSARSALHRLEREYEGDCNLFVCERRPYDGIYPVVPVRFAASGDELQIVVEAEILAEVVDEARIHSAASRFLAIVDPAIGVERVDATWIPGADFFLVEVRLRTPTRARTIGPLLRLGDRLAELLSTTAGDPVTVSTAVDLLRAGQPGALLGQRESAWLDVKRLEPRLTDTIDQIKFAMDVASFANAGGGLLIYGIEAKKVGGPEEVLRKVRPIVGTPIRPYRYRQVVDQRVHPPVAGLEAAVVDVDDGCVAYVLIPPQEEESKPFLVHGAVVDGRVMGNFISIVRRSGDETVSTDARSIHGTLATGRALLRHGHVGGPR